MTTKKTKKVSRNPLAKVEMSKTGRSSIKEIPTMQIGG